MSLKRNNGGDDMRVTIEDVAQKAGVSVVTVSRVINGVKTVRENNREKVLQAMKELDYEPNPAARILASGKTKIIGLTITNLNDTFFEQVVKSVNKQSEKKGYFLALSVLPLDEAESFLFQKDRVDGIILLCPTNEEKSIDKLNKMNIPYVLLDNQKEYDVPSVVVDNYQGGYDATTHLIELGHKRIAHISGSSIYLSSVERKRGFIDALKDKNLKPYAVEECNYTVKAGYDVMSKWIADGIVPSAVFAGDDFIALGVMNALLNAGLRIPEDVSIIGYDDQKFASELQPRLTTIRQPAAEVGKKGVELLISLLNEQAVEQHTKIKLPSELIVRDSTARYIDDVKNE